MIFVTVGTHDQGFERLIKKMDEIAGQIDEEVIIQVGYTDYEPENAEWFKFLSPHKIKGYYNNSRIIITHSGAGSLMDSITTGNIVITVPRQKKYNEHIDNQQIDLAGKMEKTSKVMSVYDIECLESCINNSKSSNVKMNDTNVLINYLKSEINKS